MAIDAGWPCTFHEYARAMKSAGHDFHRLAWAVVTHFHMDHAGLISEFIENGIRCLLFENQEDAVDPMERMILKTYKKYQTIAKELMIKVPTDGSRKYFEAAGIGGEVIVTPGHSPDSMTYISDAHEAVIGDLYPIDLVMSEDAASLKSWELIKQRKARYIGSGIHSDQYRRSCKEGAMTAQSHGEAAAGFKGLRSPLRSSLQRT